MQGVFSGVEVLFGGDLGVVDGLMICLLLHLFAQGVQLGKYLVHLLLRLPHNAPGLVFALAPGVFLGLFHLLPENPGFSGILLALLPQAVGLVLGLFQPLPFLLQLRQHILKADGFAVHLLFGGGNDRLVQPQTPGDGKGVGFARNADEQAVGRAQCGHIELTACVFHTGGGHGEGLHLGVMCGGGDERSLAAAALDDGNGQSRPLHRVSARSQLVKKQETVLIRLTQNFHGVGHMGGKGGQALLDALLVPHICQHPVKHPEMAAVFGGNLKATLGHEGQQADGFQCHGLAAGVGAGDDQRVILIPQLQRNGHRLGTVQQRMPCPPQNDAPLALQYGHGGVHPVA